MKNNVLLGTHTHTHAHTNTHTHVYTDTHKQTYIHMHTQHFFLVDPGWVVNCWRYGDSKNSFMPPTEKEKKIYIYIIRVTRMQRFTWACEVVCVEVCGHT